MVCFVREKMKTSPHFPFTRVHKWANLSRSACVVSHWAKWNKIIFLAAGPYGGQHTNGQTFGARGVHFWSYGITLWLVGFFSAVSKESSKLEMDVDTFKNSLSVLNRNVCKASVGSLKHFIRMFRVRMEQLHHTLDLKKATSTMSIESHSTADRPGSLGGCFWGRFSSFGSNYRLKTNRRDVIWWRSGSSLSHSLQIWSRSSSGQWLSLWQETIVNSLGDGRIIAVHTSFAAGYVGWIEPRKCISLRFLQFCVLAKCTRMHR